MIERIKRDNLTKWMDYLWPLLLGAYIAAGASLTPFHGDESTLIFMGRDYFYLFQEGDLSKLYYDSGWEFQPDEQHLRLLNGTVSKNVYGWLAASAGMSPDDINGQWHWGLDYASNSVENRIPDAGLLRQARLASALQLAAAAAIFFVFVRMLFGWQVAYAASALFALHPAILLNGRRAMMEGSHLLGMTLVLLAAAWLIRQRDWQRYLLLGLCSGLAVAAKHPNVLVVGLAFFALGSRWMYEAAQSNSAVRRGAIISTAKLLVAGALAVLVFYLMNPAWWKAPLDVAGEALALRVELLDAQIALFGGYDSFAAELAGYFERVFVVQAQYFEVGRWAGYEEISAQILAYESSGLAGWGFGSAVGGFLVLVLTVAAVIAFFRKRDIDAGRKWLLIVCGGGIAVMALILTPLPWQRYYLPVLPFVLLMVAYSLTSGAMWLGRQFSSRLANSGVLA